MLASSNMPRLALKRALQDIIVEDMGLSLNIEQTQQGFTDDVTAWVTGMSETFSRLRGGNGVAGECTITIQVFSELNETGVHKAIRDLMTLSPANPRFIETGVHVTDIEPTDSETSYGDESTDGGVIATLSIKFSYLTRF
ncbi:hypothetical protein J8002_001895 [Salmonella enterica]|nr:hypothetical protein [Salmonella enterica]